MSDPSDRTPVRNRSGRRPVPALIFLLVLALAALLVWWNVLREDAATQAAQAAACSSAEAAPPSLDPTTVTVRVFNSTSIAGLANTAAAALEDRGFVVAEVGNDPHPEIKVTGVGELRFGPGNKGTADFLQVFIPGATERPDTRADDRVDVVLGPKFEHLASVEQVTKALDPLAGHGGGC